MISNLQHSVHTPSQQSSDSCTHYNSLPSRLFQTVTASWVGILQSAFSHDLTMVCMIQNKGNITGESVFYPAHTAWLISPMFAHSQLHKPIKLTEYFWLYDGNSYIMLIGWWHHCSCSQTMSTKVPFSNEGRTEVKNWGDATDKRWSPFLHYVS